MQTDAREVRRIVVEIWQVESHPALRSSFTSFAHSTLILISPTRWQEDVYSPLKIRGDYLSALPLDG